MSNFFFLDPLKSIQKYPDNIFWNQKSYQDIYNLVKKIHLPKDTHYIAIAIDNPFKFISFILACWSQGKAVIPLKKSHLELSINEIKDNVDIDLVITNENAKDYLKSEIIPKDINPKNNALLIPTSGSSGKSKLVVLSINNLFYSANATIDFYKVVQQDKWTLNLPLNHVGGIMILIRALYSGIEVVDNIEDGTIVSLVPTQLQRLLSMAQIHNHLLNMKAILLGGAPCSKKLLNQLVQLKLPVSLTYGMTENSSQICAFKPGIYPVEENQLGEALAHTDIKVIDEILCIKGNSVFSGYMNLKQFEMIKMQNGYFYTQDLAQVKNNQIHLLGRADKVIISGGENVNLNEVQDRILAMDHVLECLLLPIKCDDFGQVIVAFLKISNLISLDELKNIMKKRFKPQEIPKYFYPLECVKMKGIKISQKELKEYALAKGHIC